MLSIIILYTFYPFIDFSLYTFSLHSRKIMSSILYRFCSDPICRCNVLFNCCYFVAYFMSSTVAVFKWNYIVIVLDPGFSCIFRFLEAVEFWNIRDVPRIISVTPLALSELRSITTSRSHTSSDGKLVKYHSWLRIAGCELLDTGITWTQGSLDLCARCEFHTPRIVHFVRPSI